MEGLWDNFYVLGAIILTDDEATILSKRKSGLKERHSEGKSKEIVKDSSCTQITT